MPRKKRAERAAYVGDLIRVIAYAALITLSTAHCDPSDPSESGAMFFLKKSKPDVTSVGAAVGAPLVKHAKFTDLRPAPVRPAVMATTRVISGAPPNVAWADAHVPAENKLAFIVEGTARHPPIAVANVERRAEFWELEDAEKPTFARKRAVRIDPKQDDWVMFSILEIACLPNDQLLLAVKHHSPVRFGLYIYDIAANSCAKLSDVSPLGFTPQRRLETEQGFYESLSKLFDLLVVSPDEMLVLFYSGQQRLAAEVYYSTPGHIYAFSPKHRQPAEVLRLSAADGVVESWLTHENTLWLATQDFRDRKHIKSYAMSLDLGTLFSH
jgi:hypothetical protein